MWPCWYGRFTAGGLLVGALATTLSLLTLNPEHRLAESLSLLGVPAATSLTYFAGRASRPKLVVLAALGLDVEAVIVSQQFVVGLAFAILLPVVGVSLLLSSVRGRLLLGGVILGGLSSLVAVAVALLAGPVAALPKAAPLAVTLAMVAMTIGYGLVHIMVFNDKRMEALATARRQLEARRQAESELEATVGLLAAFMNSSPVAMQAFDAELSLTFWNRASERLFGRPASDVLGGRIPEELDLPGEAGFRDSIVRSKEGSVVEGTRVRCLARDGREIWLDVYAAPLLDHSGKAVGVASQTVDVTDRVALEARVSQAEKMEAIGALAGGIAHDFNNTLTAIMGSTQLAQLSLSGDNPDVAIARTDLDDALKAAGHAAGLTRQLLDFARKSVVRPQVLSPGRVLRELAPMLGQLLGERARLVLDVAPGAGHVNVDPGQLEQVVINLAVNARDAMPDGGTVTVRVTEESVAARPDPHGQPVPGEYVVVSVSDTGVGMDAETRSRAFDPFYTTKPIGKGTGMGLATVSGIVAMARGWIDVDSAPGEGATFRLYFPRVEEAPEVTAAAAAVEAPRPGSETVLLVEDDAAVRRFARRVLNDLGYRVLEASSGGEALGLVKDGGRDIDILVSDIVMPDMRGDELARTLASLKPELPTILCSGYPADAAGIHDVPGSVYLAKPYGAEALARVVRDQLDGKAA